MYWYKNTNAKGLIMLCSVLWGLAACRPNNINNNSTDLKYFDLKGYLSADTAKLNHAKKLVLKTVSHNGDAQTKMVSISNWGQELGLFFEADINKPAWKNSYTITADSTFLLYKAKEPAQTVREMLIKREGKNIKWILIYNRVKNILYTTTEKLTYYPDSLYLIEKDQHVKLIGNNHYGIKGVIK